MTFQQTVLAAPEAVRLALKPGKQGMKGEHRAQVDSAAIKQLIPAPTVAATAPLPLPPHKERDPGFDLNASPLSQGAPCAQK